jgi:uncharacterized membrane protein
VPAFACVIFIAACRLASERLPLGLDEILTRILLGSPSFSHMIRAVADGVDVSPPVYWSVMWAWTREFGLSDLSLRMFSALASGAAFLGAWIVCRRLAGFWPATLAVTMCFFLDGEVFMHSTQCRTYSLLVALTALALVLLQRIGREAPVSPAELLLYSCAVALLVMTQLFGFLISGVLLLSLVLSDASRGRFRPLRYLATPLGWLAFLPWVPAFIQQSKIGEPRLWIPVPPASVLWSPASYLFGLPIGAVAVVVLFAGAAFAVGRPGRTGKRTEPSALFADPVLVAGPLLVVLVPLATWFVSVLVKPIWLDRYQLPALLGWAIILSWLLRYAIGKCEGRLRQQAKGAWRPPFLGGFAAAVFVALCFLQFYQRAEELPDNRRFVGAQISMDRPVATQYSHYFLYTTFYQPRVDVYFVLDWPSALANPDAGYISDYNIMSALKRNFPEFKVVQASEFLSKNDRFYYWDKFGSNWIARVVAADKSFRETRLGANTYGVERVR